MFVIRERLYAHPVYPTRCNITQFILSGNCSTCFAWYHHPSLGAQATVSTASSICHTAMNRITFTDKVYIKIRLKLQLLLIMYFCGKCDMSYRIMNDVRTPYHSLFNRTYCILRRNTLSITIVI